MPFNKRQQQLIRKLGFDIDVCENVDSICEGNFVQYSSFKPSGLIKFAAVAWEQKSENYKEIIEFIDDLQHKLSTTEYSVYRSKHVTPKKKLVDAIVLLKSISDFDFLRIQNTEAGNYSLENEQIIKKLIQWKKQFKFRITGAFKDWVEISLDTLPKDVLAFAEDVYKFCPDSVDQGYIATSKDDNPKLFKAAIKKFPKLSVAMQKKLDKETARIEKLFKGNKDSLEEHSFETSSAMGIRLMAYDLMHSKKLFLWWD